VGVNMPTSSRLALIVKYFQVDLVTRCSLDIIYLHSGSCVLEGGELTTSRTAEYLLS
jgi:hypothetical protein